MPCQSVKRPPAMAWAWPEKPWQRVHLDFAGPFQGSMAVDAHSKWPEVYSMSSTSALKIRINLAVEMGVVVGVVKNALHGNRRSPL